MRMIRYYLKHSHRETNISDSQVITLKILKQMMVAPETEMMVAPISGTCYLEWKDVFAKLHEHQVQIINGKYFYDITLTAIQYAEITKFFNRRLENRRKVMVKEIMAKTTRSLLSILTEIEDSKTKTPPQEVVLTKV